MSFILRQSIRAARPVSIASPTKRTFAISSMRALKESVRHAPEKAADYERHKQDQLAKQKEGKNHWKPELASDSEEALKRSLACMEVARQSVFLPELLYKSIGVRKGRDRKEILATESMVVKEEKEDGLK
ncbi:hypothetical protein BOTNAR_0486g00010 [Botryotinia narcissicola]|uniref:Uncharacterized protein n=1 Tax=Botryotinia narcissicola TaxID=278944 RepID=A0A4Z1HHD9_9HELO|nr:hypothetical protein BOTNAR_0486g00010 [Botryotinia narcissicola]